LAVPSLRAALPPRRSRAPVERTEEISPVNYTVIRNGGVLALLQNFRPRFKQERT
jgi:hypothetical protein